MAKIKVQIYVDHEDWEYLGKFAEASDTNRSAMVRDMIAQFAGQMKRAFGEELTAEKVDVDNFFKVMILETSQALSQMATEVPELRKKFEAKKAKKGQQESKEAGA